MLYGIAPAAGAIFRRLVRLGRSPLTRAMLFAEGCGGTAYSCGRFSNLCGLAHTSVASAVWCASSSLSCASLHFCNLFVYRGTFAVVHRAVHRETGEVVAIKAVDKLLLDTETRVRFVAGGILPFG